MEEVRKAAEAKNMEALDNWVHHLRSSWMLIKAEQPLKVLYDAIHKESVSDEELNAAVGAVLAQGKLIVDLARKERNDGTDNRGRGQSRICRLCMPSVGKQRLPKCQHFQLQ